MCSVCEHVHENICMYILFCSKSIPFCCKQHLQSTLKGIQNPSPQLLIISSHYTNLLVTLSSLDLRILFTGQIVTAGKSILVSSNLGLVTTTWTGPLVTVFQSDTI